MKLLFIIMIRVTLSQTIRDAVLGICTWKVSME